MIVSPARPRAPRPGPSCALRLVRRAAPGRRPDACRPKHPAGGPPRPASRHSRRSLGRPSKPMTLPRLLRAALALLGAAAPLGAARSPARRNCPGAFHLRRRPRRPPARAARRQAASPRPLEKGEINLIGYPDGTSGFFPGSLGRSRKPPVTPRSAPPPSPKPPGTNLRSPTAARTTSASCSPAASATASASTVTPPPGTFYPPAPSLSSPDSISKSAPSSPGPNAPGWDFPVILDNRMKLELLLGASRSGLG